ncbi:MAG TPA: hypothetical protein VJ722_06855 [Rhodanobacteraceae bacterium]|nr:hypothetical protein [Rhodanobacteraceae bacterium]
MNVSSLTLHRPSGGAALRAILAGGFIAGTLDIGAASLINWISPLVILRFVAGGLLGPPALQGGMNASLLGLILQWAMSLLIAAIFVFAALRLRWLTARPLASGLAYGVVIYFVMNYVVMPLSAWHRVPTFKLVSFVENLLAMLLFGVIIAFCARRSLRA